MYMNHTTLVILAIFGSLIWIAFTSDYAYADNMACRTFVHNRDTTVCLNHNSHTVMFGNYGNQRDNPTPPTPAAVTANPTPAAVTANPTPAAVTANPTPAAVTANPTPAAVASSSSLTTTSTSTTATAASPSPTPKIASTSHTPTTSTASATSSRNNEVSTSTSAITLPAHTLPNQIASVTLNLQFNTPMNVTVPGVGKIMATTSQPLSGETCNSRSYPVNSNMGPLCLTFDWSTLS
jgi:hypothetical protein